MAPHGKGTYGRQVGRPPAKKNAKATGKPVVKKPRKGRMK